MISVYVTDARGLETLLPHRVRIRLQLVWPADPLGTTFGSKVTPWATDQVMRGLGLAKWPVVGCRFSPLSPQLQSQAENLVLRVTLQVALGRSTESSSSSSHNSGQGVCSPARLRQVPYIPLIGGLFSSSSSSSSGAGQDASSPPPGTSTIADLATMEIGGLDRVLREYNGGTPHELAFDDDVRFRLVLSAGGGAAGHTLTTRAGAQVGDGRGQTLNKKVNIKVNASAPHHQKELAHLPRRVEVTNAADLLRDNVPVPGVLLASTIVGGGRGGDGESDQHRAEERPARSDQHGAIVTEYYSVASKETANVRRTTAPLAQPRDEVEAEEEDADVVALYVPVQEDLSWPWTGATGAARSPAPASPSADSTNSYLSRGRVYASTSEEPPAPPTSIIPRTYSTRDGDNIFTINAAAGGGGGWFAQLAADAWGALVPAQKKPPMPPAAQDRQELLGVLSRLDVALRDAASSFTTVGSELQPLAQDPDQDVEQEGEMSVSGLVRFLDQVDALVASKSPDTTSERAPFTALADQFRCLTLDTADSEAVGCLLESITLEHSLIAAEIQKLLTKLQLVSEEYRQFTFSDFDTTRPPSTGTPASGGKKLYHGLGHGMLLVARLELDGIKNGRNQEQEDLGSSPTRTHHERLFAFAADCRRAIAATLAQGQLRYRVARFAERSRNLRASLKQVRDHVLQG